VQQQGRYLGKIQADFEKMTRAAVRAVNNSNKFVSDTPRCHGFLFSGISVSVSSL
jgi:hypothetical protein